jgi:NAD(P)-dependent dehydrogenase (short-subunit alcohol dehydrogenase family)
MSFTSEELETCLAVLQEISKDPSVMNENARFKSLIAKIRKWGKKNEGQKVRQRRTSADRQALASAAMIKARVSSVTTLRRANPAISTVGNLQKPNYCYICKTPYSQVHHFYHRLCPSCAEDHYAKRLQRTDLRGRVALLTGGRIKIGFQTALRMLRDGARVLVTTRFPYDCLDRFGQETDFQTWQDRLQIYGLDLRVIPEVEAFAQHLFQTIPALDILINNAAQTIKRPPEFYAQLLEKERQTRQSPALPTQLRLADFRASQREYLQEQHSLQTTTKYFPGLLDGDGQQLDLRPHNSWSLKLGEINTLEMVEVQLVNAVAPFILNSRLKPLLERSPFDRRFIINVSAMEGQFNRFAKTVFHPHTNMAKAALNMLTRTAAADYVQARIFMNSVDTGWVTDENPYPKSKQLREAYHFYTPLDAIDGMARIYDPIVQGIEKSEPPLFGHFLKDYVPHPW